MPEDFDAICRLLLDNNMEHVLNGKIQTLESEIKKKPRLMLNAVSSSSSGAIAICQKPEFKSIEMNHFEFERESRHSSTLGRGYASFMEILTKDAILTYITDKETLMLSSTALRFDKNSLIGDKKMLSKSCLFIFLVSNAMRSGSTVFNSYYGIQTSEYPKRTCQEIDNIRSKGQCLGTCLFTMDKIVLISHHASIKTCLYCSDITGSDIKGPHWKSYVPLPFSDGCTTYNLTSHQICLKYFPVSARYSSARNLCQAEGGDLIKIDSERKFDIFRKHHVPVANNSEIQVWVQGEKVGGQWQFDDGTPIPDICPIQMSNGTTEVHYRAKGTSAFRCYDAPNGDRYHFSCEYQL
eukprot:XP_019924896.1 PREDICTED: uncharacterized protein LOC109619397 [Crassostrea gigas]